MTTMALVSRRKFSKLMAVAAAGTAVAPLGLFHARRARAACLLNGRSSGYGPLRAKLPVNAADLGNTVIGDLRTTPLLALPDGFNYTAFSISGEAMSDGEPVPGDHDGMACFEAGDGSYVLVRNHELAPGENELGSRRGCQPPNGKVYDSFNLPDGQGGGGTTTLIVGRNGKLIRSFVSLGGTIRNCAGGPTPWGSWITCEENVSTPVMSPAVTKKHGYNFEVPAGASEGVDPVPLTAMGRFNHEAVAVDPRTGYVYQTEDRGDSAFYRFVPTEPGRLSRGGTLFAMVVDAGSAADCDGAVMPVFGSSADLRSGVLSFLGQPLAVSWVRMDDPDPDADMVRYEAQLKGAAIIARGEGAWYANDLVYFVSTSGGDIGNGQVWAYDPANETVRLLVESTDVGALDGPDNITVAPDGTLYLCEDGGSDQQSIVGVDGAGDLFQLARNVLDDSEFAGACFSPDGKKLFVNTMSDPAVTYCIWGPWQALNHRS